MKSLFLAASAAILFAGPTVAHTAILPPFPDKALTANSSEAPAGCKYVSSDKGWPADHVWKRNFPGVFKKLRGSVGPDWMVQARNVADVQKVVNFAREHNVRLTIITTGHDFHGRNTGRSGLRLDLATMKEPTVFAKNWKCGDSLKPMSMSMPGKMLNAEDIEVCKVPKKRSVFSAALPMRNHEFKFFEKRDGLSCDAHLKLAKRQMSDEGMAMQMGLGVPETNTIKLDEGATHAYARISAGIYNEQFYEQAAKSGLMTVGAQHGGVGVIGGWMQAGGHNPFAHKFGMQVDNIVELEVVTADGKFHKVSECNNPELFWALRGGGGSTFGVVTGATVKVHPTFPVVVARFFVNTTDQMATLKASSHFLQVGAKLRDEKGLQGYYYIYPKAFQSVLHMPDNFATLEHAKSVVEPLMKQMEEIAGAKHNEPTYYKYKTYKDWYWAEYGNEEMEENGTQFLSWNDGSDGPVPSEAQQMANPLGAIPYEIDFPQFPMKKRWLDAPAALKQRAVDVLSELSKRGVEAMTAEAPAQMRSQPNPRHYLDARLLSNKHVNSVSIERLATAINGTMPHIPGVHIRGFLIGGGKQAEPDEDAMGLLPAWRTMTHHFITNAVPGNIRHDYGIETLAELFPDAGGYVNEASVSNADWKRAYWGAHYPKLEALKVKYDPDNVFWCSPCVGADRLTFDDERMCTNPNWKPTSHETITPGASAKHLAAPPDTYVNMNSKKGIASLPGTPGIPHPFIPLITDYTITGKLPAKMLKSSYFKIAMGEGGSALGRYAENDPFNEGQKLTDWPLRWNGTIPLN